MKTKFEEQIIAAIQRFAAKFSSLKAAAADLGIKYETFRSWHDGTKSPQVNSLAPFAQRLGLVFSEAPFEASKDVCFVDARMVSAEDGTPPPQSEDYIAAPLVGEVGAGTGYLPADEIQSWFLVYKRLEAIRYRKNLIAVEIGKGSTSMQPTLNPGDIVLVDRDDRDIAKPGRMMLVLDPQDGSGMVKRVSCANDGDDFRITYYSDNAAKWPPMVYSLRNDFGDDWDNAIVGRVIWAWSDVREK